MSHVTPGRSPKFLVTATFLIMIIVNALANILPINGQTTGQVSDAYPNLFTPTALTFAIWGLIYLLLGLHTLYQLGLFRGSGTRNAALLSRVGLIFSLSSLANAAWIFSWHYEMIPLSMLLMIVILICLIFIHLELRRSHLSDRERFFMRLPFSVYFGWITVATIANATVLLVSLGWDGFGIPEAVWAAIVIVVSMLIGIAVMVRGRDAAYGLVLLWAYAGILVRHMSADGFSGRYPVVIVTLLICMVCIVAAEAYVLFSKQKRYS